MRYRIIKKTHPRKETEYFLQVKKWYGWRYVTVNHWHMEHSWSEPKKFLSEKEIEEYLIQEQPNKYQVIKEFMV